MERGLAFVPLDCTRCRLCSGRTQVVPAEGGSAPIAFFVGEAPGPEEDRQGRPFVGRAGKILRETLRKTGWTDDEVWITNTVKCFPHVVEDGKRRIRAPRPDESEACRRHLVAEVKRLKPRLLVALGRTAATALTVTPPPRLEEVRGTMVPARAELGGSVFLTYHPSGLHYAAGRKEAFEADLLAARGLVLGTRARE